MNLIHIKTILIFLALFLLILLLALYLSGCVDSEVKAGLEDETGREDGVNAIVSIPPQEEFLKKIGGNRIRVTTMVLPGSNPHTYEPLPGQLREVSGADIFFKIGSGIDFEIVWLNKVIEMNKDMKVIDCSEGIELKYSDPHIWLSPLNAVLMVKNIYQGLIDFDPGNADSYRSNMETYIRELEQLDRDIKGIFKENEVRMIMVVHPAWTYFADEYGLEQLAIETEGKEPTPGALKMLVEKAVENDVEVIFASPEFDVRSAETIAAETGAKVVMVSPLEKDYINNMRKIAEAFAQSSGQ
ncbi:MAG: zinc ABC transporter substrate-binding protein [Actinobacteria bacterium]|nr:zinc ABC transporter substrate-binding protein [Actinomycetota bacterium]